LAKFETSIRYSTLPLRSHEVIFDVCLLLIAAYNSWLCLYEYRSAMILMIDNYDSFTFNVVQYLRELNAEVQVVKNDELSLNEIKALRPEKIIISPGPCSPVEAGICVELIRAFASQVPILGVCLGHQCIAAAFGANIVRAREAMHGKTSLLLHRSEALYVGLPSPLRVARYHSLVVDVNSLPGEFIVDAWTENASQFDEIMGMRHERLAIYGVQFHPESIASECGHQLLANFLKL
jgi:anthranilate synthase component 2